MSENTTTSKLQKNAELIFTYVYNNKVIFISGFVLIIYIWFCVDNSNYSWYFNL